MFREFILALTARLEAVGSTPWRDPARMRAFHQHHMESTFATEGPSGAVADGTEEQVVGRTLMEWGDSV